MLTKENVLFNKSTDDSSNYVVAIESHPKDSRYQVISPETNQTIPSIMCHDAAHGGLLMTYKKSSHAKSKDDGQGWEETEVNDTLNVFDNGETRTPTIVLENHPADSRVRISSDGIVQTLSSRMGTGGGNTPMVMESSEPLYLESNEDHASIKTDGVSTSLTASMGNGSGHIPMVTEQPKKESPYDNMIVRRLTPLECVRLQGYPDNWLDIGEWIDSKGKLHKDSDAPKYKAAGNSIALPFWQWLMDRIAKQLKKDECENPTMASLFSGIGGFELCSVRAGIKPIWNSEIEEYPMAVTKKHFGED